MYHYGITIKEYREKKAMLQENLAEVWPKSNGDVGVSVDYVSMVENGKRQIKDIRVLRELCDILDIPLWEVGLSEFDPFGVDLPGKGKYLFDETLLTVETMIENAWILRQTASFPITNKAIQRLEQLFKYMNIYVSRKTRQDKKYGSLYAQTLRLKGMVFVEEERHEEASRAFVDMYRLAREIDDPVASALSCMGLGTWYSGQGKHKEAIEYLEAARDFSFETSKHLAALILAYLSRSYAKAGEKYRFEKSIETSYRIARNLGPTYGDGTDFTVHTMSDILEEMSNGYIELNDGSPTLAMRNDIEQQITADNNNFIRMWIPLDYAQAHMIMGEVEESIRELEYFYDGMKKIQSPLGISKVGTHIKQMGSRGYGNEKVLKEFTERYSSEN